MKITLSTWLNIALVVILMSSVFFMNTTADIEQTSINPYDPWYDLNDDGVIDIFDVVIVASRFNTEGTPINKTELLELNATVPELEARVGMLEAFIGIPNGLFEFDPAGFSFDSISYWNHSSYDSYGATYDEILEIVDNYYFSGSNSVYSWIQSNTGTPLHDSAVFQNLWTKYPVATASDYITLWVSGQGYTTSSRYRWYISLILTDGTNTYSEKLREKDVEPMHPDDYDNYNATATGADGNTWKRYTRLIPDYLDKSNLTVIIQHSQSSWDYSSTSSWYHLDSVYFSNSQGNP